MEKVIAAEGVKIGTEAREALVRLSRGDMRRALNVLQACHASTMPMPVVVSNGGKKEAAQPPPPEDREEITPATIYDCIASPHPEDIMMIRDTLLSTPDVASCLSTIAALKAQRGLALADVLQSLAEELAELEVPAQTRVRWLEGLAEVEYRLAGGGSEVLQVGGLVGVVREGVELMDQGGGGR